jgi:hypothetical protein
MYPEPVYPNYGNPSKSPSGCVGCLLTLVVFGAAVALLLTTEGILLDLVTPGSGAYVAIIISAGIPTLVVAIVITVVVMRLIRRGSANRRF